jgi:hypothetical protein
MIRRVRRGFFSIFALLPLWAGAVAVDGLYETEVRVSGQGLAEREEAIRAAMSDVLLRLTGQRETLGLPVTVTLIERAPQYVQQYRYLRDPASKPPVPRPPGAAPPVAEAEQSQRLWISFDAAAVDQFLFKNHLPVWGKARPSTLVWIAVQEEDRRSLVDANAPTPILSALDARARARGLPLVFPLWDLEDQQKISAADVWAGFRDALLAASKRYATEAVLVGQVFQDAIGGWQGRWTLYEGKDVFNWSSQGDILEPVVIEAIDGAADRLASRYASGGASAKEGVYVSVGDVKSVDDYARVTKYLGALTPVAKIEVALVEAARVTYRLELRGNRDGLERAITLGSTLVVDRGDAAPPPGLGPVLAYRLIP